MTRKLLLDPAREARVERRLTEHFSRLGYPDVADAVHWSLSVEGAEVRFRYLLPLLVGRLESDGSAGAAAAPTGEAKIALTKSGLRLLVSGMGAGSEMIVARNLGFGEIHGTEVDAFYVTLVADRLAGRPGFFPIPVDGENVPYVDGAFDIVISGHIVEHTADPDAYVAEHLRVLKPGGYFLIEFPTRFHTRELHTGLPSIEWLPDRLRTAILQRIGSGAFRFSEETRKKCRAITETALKQVSLRRVRRWVAESGSSASLVAKGRPGPGVVYGIFRKSA